MDEPAPARTGRSRVGRALPLAATGLVVALAIGPFPQPDFDGAWEDLPHVVAFATLTALLLGRAVRRAEARSRPAWHGAAGLAAAMIALGALIEVGQRLVRRDVAIGDVQADAIGVALALLGWHLVRIRRASRSPGTPRAAVPDAPSPHLGSRHPPPRRQGSGRS